MRLFKEVLQEYIRPVGQSFKLWQDPWHPNLVLFTVIQGHLVCTTGLSLDSLLAEVMQDGSWIWPETTNNEVLEMLEELVDGKFLFKSGLTELNQSQNKCITLGM
ncbi:UNVERIFIED_CONTAM: hypothetical protein Sradi_4938800 [Sesamum radiatum]|uniref:Uncharacterized protein n=1 Tax=Sesamum radiatum TaxID=300843 RepID=A0AAW2MEG6_SESRA